MKRWLKALAPYVAFLALVLVLFAGMYFVAVMSTPWSLSHRFEGEFAELPASDRPLEEAIERVEGVISNSAHVERDPTGRKVRIRYGTGGDLWNRPPLPDVARLCRRLGYKGQIGELKPVRGDSPEFR